MDLFQYRITHYDPALRDAEGRFLGDRWTCVSDIGKTFDGRQLSKDDYLETETAYVAALLNLFDASGLSHLRATNVRTGLQQPDNDDPAVVGHDDGTMSHHLLPALDIPKLAEDEPVARAAIEQIVRLSLREISICRLEIDGRFFAHFGWDFYMYVGCKIAPVKVESLLSRTGLFVEQTVSPYACGSSRSDGFTLEVFDRATDTHIRDIPLEGLSLNEARALLAFSDEHPLCGSFDIPHDRQAELESLMDSSTDFSRYCYQLASRD